MRPDAYTYHLTAESGAMPEPYAQVVQNEPLTVSVTRGGHLESSHLVHAVAVDPSGVINAWGDANRLTMPRSALKSIQVLPLLVSGAADAYAVSDDELALASASHGAEPLHVQLMEAWLDRIGLDESALECGPADPMTKSAANALYASGSAPTAIHNCCSGKHTGFLTIARHLGVDPVGYLDPQHPVQKLVTRATEIMTGVAVSEQVPAVDGCGIPVYRIPLTVLAQAMLRLATGDGLDSAWQEATRRVRQALPTRAHLVSGAGRAEVLVTEATPDPFIVKGGAEGVFMAVAPTRRLAFALKAEDGGERAAREGLAALAHHLGLTPHRVWIDSPVRNRPGAEVGTIDVTIP